MLVGHAHLDHAGAVAWFKKRTGARLEVMAEDVPAMETGGRRDFAYRKLPFAHFRGATVDRHLCHGSTVQLEEIVLTALRTPGHTPGATTWITEIRDEDDHCYKVAFLDGSGVNPGYRLVDNPDYHDIAHDYRRTFEILEKLHPDIWLTHHNELDDFWRRRHVAITRGVSAWENGSRFPEWVAAARAAFEAALAQQEAKGSPVA